MGRPGSPNHSMQMRTSAGAHSASPKVSKKQTNSTSSILWTISVLVIEFSHTYFWNLKAFFFKKKKRERERERVIICNNYFFVQRTLLGKKKVEMFL